MNIVSSAAIVTINGVQRLAVTYMDVNEETGQIIEDNKRYSRIIRGTSIESAANAVLAFAQECVEE